MTRSIHTARSGALRVALVAARKAAGLTHVEVAELLGRPQSFACKVDAVDRRLDVVELLDLLDVRGADPVAVVDEVQRVGRLKVGPRRRGKRRL